MSKNDLLSALCPSPNEWKDMDSKEFQECVGKILGYLLERDQKGMVINTISAFVGGLIGGTVTVLTYLGLR
jgi:hypothetical protein